MINKIWDDRDRLLTSCIESPKEELLVELEEDIKVIKNPLRRVRAL